MMTKDHWCHLVWMRRRQNDPLLCQTEPLTLHFAMELVNLLGHYAAPKCDRIGSGSVCGARPPKFSAKGPNTHPRRCPSAEEGRVSAQQRQPQGKPPERSRQLQDTPLVTLDMPLDSHVPYKIRAEYALQMQSYTCDPCVAPQEWDVCTRLNASNLTLNLKRLFHVP